MTNKADLTASELAPATLQDALSLVKDGYQPFCGGSDLIIRRHSIHKARSHSLGKKQDENFKPVFYTGRIKELGKIEQNLNSLRIGSAVSLSRIIKSGLCPEVLSTALESIASPGIRNMATLAGNICNASPAGDSLPPLYILETVIETSSFSSGRISRRQIPIADFITAPGTTALADDEIVSAIIFELPEGFGSVFRKVGTRAANALSKLSIASCWKIEDELITDFRLAVGACGPTVLRAAEAEALISGHSPKEVTGMKNDILDVWKTLLKPIDDQRSTADYRRNTALRLIDDIISKIGG